MSGNKMLGVCAKMAILGAKDIIQKESSDENRGLSLDVARQRLAIYGPNELTATEKETLIAKFISQFKDPLIMLLFASAVISVLMGEKEDAVSITLAVIIVVTVGFVQEYRSDKALEELNYLVPNLCRCIRDGKMALISASELVPGDIVELTMGDKVPADIRLIAVTDLEIDESSLTGEGLPQHKTTDPLAPSAGALNTIDLHNIAFMGTLVCSGHAKGIVVATGAETELGHVCEMMSETVNPRSPLQVKMDELGQHLSVVSIGIIVVIGIVGVVQGRQFMEMFQVGVSLAVAAIPEGLPICVTVTLALGVMRMASKNAIVKKLPAVEALGCTNVICVDKTGTLTLNQMTVTQIYCHRVPEKIVFSGIGYHAAHGTGVFVDGHTANHATCPALTRLLEIGVICNNARCADMGVVRGEKPIGQPTEIALLVAASKLGLADERQLWHRKREISFSSDGKWMAVHCSPKTIDDQAPGTSKKDIYFVKGMVEKILSQSQFFSLTGALDDVVPLDEAEKEKILEVSKTMAREGLRVLALAWGSDIDSLCFAGLIGFVDPQRENVLDAIIDLADADILVKMITGDSEETAVSVARSLQIYEDGMHLAISGAELDAMTEDQLASQIESISVFYRTAPRHKLKIVVALQKIGKVVAMTGDGVNDALALKAADIGIAMGKSGTDVSKEAADMILVDDSFATIVEAVREGKGIFFNIRNFLRFQLSTSVAALSMLAITSFLGLQSPLNAMQILWINIIMDGPPAQTLGVEPVDHDVMLQPPRRAKDPIISAQLIKRVLTSAFLIVLGTLSVFYHEMEDGQVTHRDTTMTFTTFVFFDLFNALTCRSEYRSVFSIGLFANKPFLGAIGLSLLGQLMVIFTPPLQAIFKTEALSLWDLMGITLLSSSVFVIDEIRKFAFPPAGTHHEHPKLYTKVPTEMEMESGLKSNHKLG